MSFWSKLKDFGSSAYGLGKRVFSGVKNGLGKVNHYSKQFNSIMKTPLAREVGKFLPENAYNTMKKYGHQAENYSSSGLDTLKDMRRVGNEVGQIFKDNSGMFDRKKPQRNQPPPNSYDRGRYIKEPRDQRQPGEDRTQKQGKQKQGKQDRSGIERLQKKPETQDVEDSGNPYEGLNLL